MLSEHVLRADLSHVSAERIVAGAHRDIRDLVEILAALSRHRPVPQPGAHTAGRADAWAAGSDAGEAAAYAASADAEEIERIAKEAEAEVRRKTKRAKRAAAPKGGKQMVQLTAKAKAGASDLPPVLVVGSAGDRVVDRDGVLETAAHFGLPEPVFLAGAAHDSMLDTRWDDAADALEAFLDGLPPP